MSAFKVRLFVSTVYLTVFSIGLLWHLVERSETSRLAWWVMPALCLTASTLCTLSVSYADDLEEHVR